MLAKLLVNRNSDYQNQAKIYTSRLKKRGELPSQLLEKRLQALNELEREIEDAKKSAPVGIDNG